jgi:putative oxidoreductase
MKNYIKNFLQSLNDVLFAETRFKDLSLALLRIFFGTSILVHGLYKAADLYYFSHLVGSMHHPMAALLSPILAYSQVLIGALLILGLFTRLSSFFTFLATMYTMLFIYHMEPLFNRELVIAYFFISLVFFFRGGAKYSLDDKIHQYFEHSLKKLKQMHL